METSTQKNILWSDPAGKDRYYIPHHQNRTQFYYGKDTAGQNRQPNIDMIEMDYVKLPFYPQHLYHRHTLASFLCSQTIPLHAENITDNLQAYANTIATWMQTCHQKNRSSSKRTPTDNSKRATVNKLTLEKNNLLRVHPTPSQALVKQLQQGYLGYVRLSRLEN